jgi:hypothetical protein
MEPYRPSQHSAERGWGREHHTMENGGKKFQLTTHVTPNKYAEVYGKMGIAIMYRSTVLILCQIHRLYYTEK